MLQPISDTGSPAAACSITRSWPVMVRCSKSPAARSGISTWAPAARKRAAKNRALLEGGRGEAVKVEDAESFLDGGGRGRCVEFGELDLGIGAEELERLVAVEVFGDQLAVDRWR